MRIPKEPPVGHVVAYEYLWLSQAAGREDGQKTYPSALILAKRQDYGGPLVYALGISHKPPTADERALELPAKLKRWTGLDAEPSWIYTDQLNIFVWPGPDLRPADRLSSRPDARGGCVIAPLPVDWFEAVKLHLAESRRLLLLRATLRSP